MPPASTGFNTAHTSGSAQVYNINGDLINHAYEKDSTSDRDVRIYQWLAAPDSSGNFHAARKKHHDKTGAWFIEGREYVNWKDRPDSTMWIYGIPGSGKTIACSTVIEDIRRHCEDNPKFACAYFFFDNRSAQTDLCLHDGLLRSLIRELCHQSTDMPDALVKTYDRGHQQPSVASLELTLRKIIEGYEHTYIIIDALDECADREEVLSCIENLLKWVRGKLHVLISSRREADIEERLNSIHTLVAVALGGSSVDADIGSYIDAMLSKMTRWDARIIARVKEALTIGADGMFRWVDLQIMELKKCCSLREVEAQLRTLPKDLEGLYEKILLRCTNRQDLKQFLIWLAFSTRRLRAEEFTDVVTVDFSSDSLPSYHPDLRYFGPTDMLVRCSSFVTEFEGTVKLAHMSVKEYLVSEHIKDGPAFYFSINRALADSLITQTCLAYLLYLGARPFVDKATLASFPLCPYAAEYWIFHMVGCDDENVSQMMAILFSLEDNALTKWVRSEYSDRPWMVSDCSNNWEMSADIAYPLYYASMHGQEEMVYRLLSSGADVQAGVGKYGTPLQAASYGGHDAVVQSLLDNGADVNGQGGRYGAPLQAASYGGHGAVVRLLLDNGADVNGQGGRYGAPLQAASYGGHGAVVRLLLDNGADVNGQGGRYGTPLQAASYGGHDAVVQLLLDNGADVNGKGGTYGTPLQAASYRGRQSTVHLLLENDADVNTHGGEYGGALQAASCRDWHTIVRLLLEAGADVNAQGGKYGTVLQAALYSEGDDALQIVRLLVEKGADVEQTEEMTGTAMRVWHFEDIPPMVELLIENRADLKEMADFMGPALGDGFLLECKLQLLKNINQRVYEFGNDEGDEEEASEWQEEYAEARETWANAHYDNDGELDSEEEELDPGWETGESLNGEENSDQEMEADQEHPGGEYWLSDDEAENNSFKAIMIREAKAFGLFAFPVGYASGDDSDWHTAEDSDDDSDWHTAEDGERVNDHDVNV